MAIIGTFSKTSDGYSKATRTMIGNVKASFAANDKNGNARAPDFWVMAGKVELGQIRTMAGAGE
jgi:uncharacterized protein (DUF736 family)